MCAGTYWIGPCAHARIRLLTTVSIITHICFLVSIGLWFDNDDRRSHRMLAITFVVIQPTLRSQTFEFGSYYRALKITHPISPDHDCCVLFYSQYRHYHKIHKLHPFLFTSHGNGRISIYPSIRLLRSFSKRLLTSLLESLLFQFTMVTTELFRSSTVDTFQKHLYEHI